MKIGLVTDSTSDLPADILQRYDIFSIPAILIIGEKQYRDSIDMSREQYYSQLPQLMPPPTTASPAPGAFEAVYKDLFKRGYTHILSIHAASELTAIYNTAKLVAEKFNNTVSVFDSRQLSLGLGFQVIEAAKAIKEKLSPVEIMNKLTEMRKRLEVHAVLDTLEQLKRSGRISWAKSGIGSIMQLKLFIELKEGEVLRAGQVRSRNKAVEALVTLIQKFGEYEQFAMLHTNAEQEARKILQKIQNTIHQPPLLINVTTTIGTHVGVNALGFAGLLAKK